MAWFVIRRGWWMVFLVAGFLAGRPMRAVEEAGGNNKTVVVDGVEYTWEEALKKFPEMRKGAGENAPAKAEGAAAEAGPEKAGGCKICKSSACSGCKDGRMPAPEIVEPDAWQAELNARNRAREQAALDERIGKLIERLALPGWRDAYAELVKVGKPAVPALIEALEGNAADPVKLHAYPPAAPGRYTRQAHHGAVVFEVLDDLIRNHSSYHGQVPGQDKKEWTEFWASNGESVVIAK